jgi:hypothetical protein
VIRLFLKNQEGPLANQVLVVRIGREIADVPGVSSDVEDVTSSGTCDQPTSMPLAVRADRSPDRMVQMLAGQQSLVTVGDVLPVSAAIVGRPWDDYVRAFHPNVAGAVERQGICPDPGANLSWLCVGFEREAKSWPPTLRYPPGLLSADLTSRAGELKISLAKLLESVRETRNTFFQQSLTSSTSVAQELQTYESRLEQCEMFHQWLELTAAGHVMIGPVLGFVSTLGILSF